MTRTAFKARLYVADNLAMGMSIIPNRKQQHYLASVMRLVTGDIVALFNGVDGDVKVFNISIVFSNSMQSITIECHLCLISVASNKEVIIPLVP